MASTTHTTKEKLEEEALLQWEKSCGHLLFDTLLLAGIVPLCPNQICRTSQRPHQNAQNDHMHIQIRGFQRHEHRLGQARICRELETSGVEMIAAHALEIV